MIEVRPFDELGRSKREWLDARHHFSIGDYRAPDRMGWGAIRVWNDDEFAPGSGFPMHPHQDMEIVTYVRTGAITHEDSLGNKGRTVAGDVQVMSAGTGIRHSEFNLESDPTFLFQIWLTPDVKGVTPRWDTRPFPKADRSGRLVTLASGFPSDSGALPISAAARVLAGTLESGQAVEVELQPSRHAYLVALNGAVEVNGVHAYPRDGVAITGERRLTISAKGATEIVLVDAR
jgi:hypothetical protein